MEASRCTRDRDAFGEEPKESSERDLGGDSAVGVAITPRVPRVGRMTTAAWKVFRLVVTARALPVEVDGTEEASAVDVGARPDDEVRRPSRCGAARKPPGLSVGNGRPRWQAWPLLAAWAREYGDTEPFPAIDLELSRADRLLEDHCLFLPEEAFELGGQPLDERTDAEDVDPLW